MPDRQMLITRLQTDRCNTFSATDPSVLCDWPQSESLARESGREFKNNFVTDQRGDSHKISYQF